MKLLSVTEGIVVMVVVSGGDCCGGACSIVMFSVVPLTSEELEVEVVEVAC